MAAFIWAFIDNSSAQKKTSVARDLKDLVQLKEDGILSEKEFEKERKNLLG